MAADQLQVLKSVTFPLPPIDDSKALELILEHLDKFDK